MTNSYIVQDNRKVPIMLNWFGREGLQFVQVLNNEKQENVKPVWGSLK